MDMFSKSKFSLCLVITPLLMASCDDSAQQVDDSTRTTASGRYPIVHTHVVLAYNNTGAVQGMQESDDFYGQDAQYIINAPSYQAHGDGTVTDVVTGLMWQQDMGDKMTMEEALQKLTDLNTGKYNDWRIPSIKELFSLADYSGRVFGDESVKLFIDTNYFHHPLGNAGKGEREIDAQTWSGTDYRGKTMVNDVSRFGFNFVDGRIKSYPVTDPGTRMPNKLYFRFVRGNTDYGKNNFTDNGDGTITDGATGLMWQKADNGQAVHWQAALSYARNLTLANHNDWRLPTVKELQSIVDYTRSVQQNNAAAIDPLFGISSIKDPDGKKNYPFFWSATTLLDGPNPGNQAAYVCFGNATGKVNGQLVDAHGAGAVRSDPKQGSTNDYPKYFGPQGDIQYVYNYVRCVRR